MQRRFLLYIIFLIGTSVTGSAQTSFNWGPEVGFSFCGFKQTTSAMRIFDVTTTSYIPGKSILIGFNSQLDIKKHFNINVGLRYLSTSEKHEWIRTGRMFVSEDEMTNYVTTNTTEQLYQKISLPLSIGFQFHIGNIATNLFVGYNQNYFLNGSYIETHNTDCAVDLFDIQYTTGQNPLTATISVNRFSGQLYTGFSFTYKNSFVLKTEANFGGYLSFAQATPNYFCVLYGGGMKNNDYVVSLSYLF